jgi:hypothetical protein
VKSIFAGNTSGIETGSAQLVPGVGLMSINSGRHANHLARNRLALLAGSYGFDGATLEVAEQ